MSELDKLAAKGTKHGAAAAAGPTAPASTIRTAALIGTWITLSATVILFNKYLLSYAGFHYPIALTLLHMLFCSVCAALLVHFGHRIGCKISKPDITSDMCALTDGATIVMLEAPMRIDDSCRMLACIAYASVLPRMMSIHIPSTWRDAPGASNAPAAG